MNKAILGISGLILLACGLWYFYDYFTGADTADQDQTQPENSADSGDQTAKKPPLEIPFVDDRDKDTTPPDKDKVVVKEPPVPAAVAAMIAKADTLKRSGDVLAARNAYSDAFKAVVFNDMEFKERAATLSSLRASLKALNSTIYYDTGNLYGEQEFYKIRPGDSMQNIARDHGVPMERLAMMNGIKDPNRIVAGKTLKIVKGAFHVYISLKDRRLYVLHGDGQHYFCEYEVSVGKEGTSTPLDIYTVADKQEKTHWTDPDTMDIYGWGDPQYPLGTRWIKLVGDKHGDRGIGIHGQSGPAADAPMGQATSHGCIRMRNADVEVLYGLLSVEKSRVTIRK